MNLHRQLDGTKLWTHLIYTPQDFEANKTMMIELYDSAQNPLSTHAN